jgi:hypothetical protein
MQSKVNKNEKRFSENNKTKKKEGKNDRGEEGMGAPNGLLNTKKRVILKKKRLVGCRLDCEPCRNVGTPC